MKLSTLILRGLVHHASGHLGVVLGTAVAAATLVGALVVGDSVRASLARQAHLRIGQADTALVAHDRFFRAALADELETALPGLRTAPVVALAGVAARTDGGRRVHDVQLYGIDERFLALAPGDHGVATPGPGEVQLAPGLARDLEVGVGDTLVIRVERPSAIPGDMVLARDEDSIVGLRLSVAGLLSGEAFANFGLRASQLPPANAFVNVDWLRERVELEPRCNLLLAAGERGPEGVARLDAALAANWEPADAELALREAEDHVELVSGRIFMDTPVVEALEAAPVPLLGVVTYFVNTLAVGERQTPYSMVSALGTFGARAGEAPLFGVTDVVPADLGLDEVVIGRWLQEDLQAEAGDELELRYFFVDPSRKLVERSERLRVRGTVELEGLAGDPTLMPDFPGLADSEDCDDWEPGVPVDLDRIRDNDEVYWDEWRGTPKAFLSLDKGRELWGSRFGSLTAVRFAKNDREAVEETLRSGLDPAALGLFFQDVRTPAESSANAPTDFGGLFLGLSFFLIVAAVLLTALQHGFGLERRSGEVGLLLAVGYRPGTAGRIFFAEGLLLALLGVALGAALGLGYTRVVLYGLDTVWKDAVGRTNLVFHASPVTVLTGAGIALAASLGAILTTLRRVKRMAPMRLLSSRGGLESVTTKVAGPLVRALPVLLVVGALVLSFVTDPNAGPAAAGAFFGAGFLVLLAGILQVRTALYRPRREDPAALDSLGRLGWRNAARRAGRSLAIVALMASGTFLVLGIGANHLGPTPPDAGRDSGTGGFALHGRASLPILQDLNTERGLEAWGLYPEDLPGVSFVPLRVRDGDDGSCLNLSTPQEPRLVAVDPALLVERGAFRFTATAEERDDPWSLLTLSLGDGAIPAIGDATSLQWTLKKGIGDRLTYRDERGQPFEVEIVGMVSDSILQGDLVIGERPFEELFPSESGHRVLLVDAPLEGREEAAATLSRSLADVGLELVPTAQRLDGFHAVQNTYLVIFQVLGGLGLLLGSVGLGSVVLRNTLERRGELALARALGFRPAAVRWWILSEYGRLLLLGLGVGAIAALVACWPTYRAASGATPPIFLVGLLAAIGLNGLLWITLATRSAVRGSVVRTLQSE